MANNLNKFKHLILKNWQLLIENAPLIIAIIVVFYISIIENIATKTPQDLLTTMIWILGLLATSILLERLLSLRKITLLCKETNDYLIERVMKPSIDSIMSDRKSLLPLENRLQSPTDIAITGGSLFQLAHGYFSFFEQKVKDGCHLRFLMLKPGCEASRLVEKYVVYETHDPDEYNDQLLTALKRLYRLKQQNRNLVEIKTYECVPPFSLLICDPKKDSGSIMVELYTHAVSIRDRPEFVLHALREPRWYSFFLEQFNQMWEEATPWEPIQEVES